MSRKKPQGRPLTPEICPVCGEDVPPNALACSECGACHNSGWKEGAEIHDGLDMPDEDFDYEGYVKREFGGGAGNPAGGNLIWWVTGLVLLLILLAGALRMTG